MQAVLKRVRIGFCVAALSAPAVVQAQLSEHFDDVSTLSANGWVITNNSQPLGTSSWYQGNERRFAAYDGSPTSYIAADLQSVPGEGTASTWLITPEQTITNGWTFSFFTRIRVPTIRTFPDRLELRLSTAGSSTNVGSSALSVGDFSTLLLSINPDLNETDYPTEWTRYTATIAGFDTPVTGRFAFRYFVTNAGDESINGDYVGVDAVRYGLPQADPTPVPEPASITLLAGGLVGLALVRRRRVQRLSA